VVVILIGEAGSSRTIGQALAAALGWRFEASAADLRGTVARAAGRREPLVTAAPGLSAAEQDFVRGELREVRFVRLGRGSATDQPFPDLAVNSLQPAADVIAAIRMEFGV
jgi:hypothetical protein